MTRHECPQCSFPGNEPTARKCTHCSSALFVPNLAYLESLDRKDVDKYLAAYSKQTRAAPDDFERMFCQGLCYLHMGTHSLAKQCFERVIELSPDFAAAYYYFVLASAGGRRLMTLPLSEIRKLEEYLSTACQLDTGKPHYSLLLAMLKHDYYESHGMRVPPPGAAELLSEIEGLCIDEEEVKHITKAVRVGDEGWYYQKVRIAPQRVGHE